MEKCTQIWNWDLDGMSDLEFDDFLDHALTCRFHEYVLQRYERRTEQILRGAYCNDSERHSWCPGILNRAGRVNGFLKGFLQSLNFGAKLSESCIAIGSSGLFLIISLLGLVVFVSSPPVAKASEPKVVGASKYSNCGLPDTWLSKLGRPCRD